MGYGIKMLVRGDYACFTRPEMKVERVSYDVPTPAACRGILESIYWKPAIRWHIDKIHVLKPVRFMNIRRNEVKSKVLLRSVQNQMNGSENDICIYTKDEISQRASLVLKDVLYGIEAHFELTKLAGETDTDEKHYNIALRRLKQGQCFKQPVLGCREFSAAFEYTDSIPESPLKGDIDLGFMLYDMKFEDKGESIYSDNANPVFYRPHMINGIIDVSLYLKEEIC